MARKRMLSPSFFQSERLAACSAHARLLYEAIWTLCDRDGRMKWNPLVVHGFAFPFEPALNVEGLAQELHAAGCIRLYRVAGKRYLDVPSFGLHQRVHKHEPSANLPPFAGDTSSEPGQTPSPALTMSGPDRSISESESESETKNPPNPLEGVSVKSRRKKREAKEPEVSPEHQQVFDKWKALQEDTGIRVNRKSFPAGWGVQARIDEAGVEAVVCVVEWAHSAKHERAVGLRDRGYLGQTLFRPSRFPEYDGLAQRWANDITLPGNAAEPGGWNNPVVRPKQEPCPALVRKHKGLNDESWNMTPQYARDRYLRQCEAAEAEQSA